MILSRPHDSQYCYSSAQTVWRGPGEGAGYAARQPRLRGHTLNDPRESRADSARGQILRAATRQFAQKPYSQVSLDDILAEAELTKGAMYFHFRSKHALALAIIEEYTHFTRAAIGELLAHDSRGLETLIDVAY